MSYFCGVKYLKALGNSARIAVCAPARKISKSEIIPFEKWCNSNFGDLFYSENLFLELHQMSGTDIQRANDLNAIFARKDIDAVFFARGGYGTIHILDLLNFDLLSQNPKWLCGFSDISVLHMHTFANIGLPTLHSIMPISFFQYNNNSDFNTSASLTASFLKNGHISYRLPNTFDGLELSNFKIIGGNLSVVYSLLGSNSIPQNQPFVIFLEDLDEYLYHIDRMLFALKRASLFSNCIAVFVGSFTDLKDNTIPYGLSVEDIFKTVLKELNIPIYFGYPSGHSALNYPIPFGVNANISNNTITFALD
jgi:muramoyltetrapeptide carboxypeptidase